MTKRADGIYEDRYGRVFKKCGMRYYQDCQGTLYRAIRAIHGIISRIHGSKGQKTF